MNPLFVIFSLSLSALALPSALAQSDDMAEERARLANQRIQVDAERRAREEEERLQREAEQAHLQNESDEPLQSAGIEEPDSETSVAQETATSNPVVRGQAAPGNEIPADRADMYRVLEQLRELGRLKDDGYVTEEEFATLKRKILDSAL